MEPKTRAEQMIEDLMRQLDPNSPRYHVLASARQFKSSWVDLGDKLTRVQRKQLYLDWGYDGFDDYCSKEIRIRRQTAQKLTQAFGYLEREAPEYLGDEPERKTIADFRAVDLLRQAREEQDFNDEEFEQLRRAVLEEQRSLPTIRTRFNQVVRGHESPESAQHRSLAIALQAARRLRSALAEVADLAGELPAQLEEFETRLLRQLENSDPDSEGLDSV